MCHRFSFDYSVLWLFCLHNILPTNSSIFQRFCSAVSFLTVWAAKKNRSLLSFIFFFPWWIFWQERRLFVQTLSWSLCIYIYFPWRVQSVHSDSIFPYWFLFLFFCPIFHFFFFLYFLLLLLIFKKTKLSNYIYVFSSLILYT